MTKIKLCGLTRLCEIEAVNDCKPDYIGFVFAKNSRRYLPFEEAVRLRERLSQGISVVGVFVREEIPVVAKLLNEGVIDLAQLHGGEEEEYLAGLRKLTNKPVIKAFRVECKEDICEARDSSADYILLDSGSGGTGKVFRWELVKDLDRPYFLAGGLNLENIRDALETLHPYGVDISSGAESNGKKDPEKIHWLVSIVKNKRL